MPIAVRRLREEGRSRIQSLAGRKEWWKKGREGEAKGEYFLIFEQDVTDILLAGLFLFLGLEDFPPGHPTIFPSV